MSLSVPSRLIPALGVLWSTLACTDASGPARPPTEPVKTATSNHSGPQRSAVGSGSSPGRAQTSFDFTGLGRPAGSDATAPMELTAADGTGLRLVSLRAKAVVEGPLAFTELHLKFFNPEPRVREGRFRITLPSGATVSRLAMRIGDRWQEGEVVERQAARRAYEDFLHRRQDPALMEKSAGNAFSARVFPIPARGHKELILSYSQELSEASYALPLRGLPELGELDVSVLVGVEKSGSAPSSLGADVLTHERVHVAKQSWTPDADFVVPLQGALHSALRHQNLAVARVTPVVQREASPIHGWVVLVDRSASRALGFERQLHRVQALIQGLAQARGKKVPLVVAAFDQTVEPIFDGVVGDFGAEPIERMKADWAMGASSVSAALDWARERMKDSEQVLGRMLVVTDGVSTAGEIEGDALRERVARLGQVGLRRLDVLAVGGIRDLDAMQAWTRVPLAERGVVVDADRSLQQIGRRLSSATHSSMKVQVEGARWVWPETLDGLQPDETVLIYADVPKDGPLRIQVDGRPMEVGDVTPVPRPLLERAWVKARIARLQHQRDTLASADADLRDALEKQIVELSTRHRVLSDFTALLVLETEADYHRFGIDRTRASSIMTVGESGIQIRSGRRELELPPPPPIPQLGLRKGDAFGGAASANGPTGRAGSRGADQVSNVFGPSSADGDAEGVGGLSVTGRGRGGGGRPEGLVEDTQVDRAEAHRWDSSEQAESEPSMEPPADRAPAPAPRRAQRMRIPRRRPAAVAPSSHGGRGTVARAEAKKKTAVAITGKLAKVHAQLGRGKVQEALSQARAWTGSEPGDVLAWVALGEAAEAAQDPELALRAYGSIIDLFPSRADLRRYAGQRLERLARSEAALQLAIDTYRKARAQRPDHPASHRLLAYALIRNGQPEQAFHVLREGADRSYPPGRFRGVPRIFGEDLALIAAAWKRAEPGEADAVDAQLKALGVSAETEPSVRFVLYWETDANDVDFHIHDGRGGHAYYSDPELPSGGELYADVTTGYGPECFTIRGPAKGRAYPYRMEAHYYRRGPMGYGMGMLQVLEHDGAGALRVESRPFVVMNDGAYLDLGSLSGPLSNK